MFNYIFIRIKNYKIKRIFTLNKTSYKYFYIVLNLILFFCHREKYKEIRMLTRYQVKIGSYNRPIKFYIWSLSKSLQYI